MFEPTPEMVERYVRKYGEPFRPMVASALDFLKGKPWVDESFSVDRYMIALVQRARPSQAQTPKT